MKGGASGGKKVLNRGSPLLGTYLHGKIGARFLKKKKKGDKKRSGPCSSIKNLFTLKYERKVSGERKKMLKRSDPLSWIYLH